MIEEALENNQETSEAGLHAIDAQEQSENLNVSQTSEKMLPQSKVNEIVKEQISRAYAKGKKEALANIHSNMQENTQALTQSGLTSEQVQEIAESAAKRHQEALISKMQENALHQQANKVYQELSSKISLQKNEYPDFDDTVSNVFGKNVLSDMQEAQIAHLVNMVDNSGDVLYELGKNVRNLSALVGVLHAPKLAEIEIRKLSASLAENKKIPVVNQKEPLSQIRQSFQPSDSDSKSVSEYQKILLKKYR